VVRKEGIVSDTEWDAAVPEIESDLITELRDSIKNGGFVDEDVEAVLKGSPWVRSPDNAYSGTDVQANEYIAKAQLAIHAYIDDLNNRRNSELDKYLTLICTECNQFITDADGRHVRYLGYVLVGCQGYWLLNPALLDMSQEIYRGDPGEWEDWTEQDASSAGA
jgi:hypothetical protein